MAKNSKKSKPETSDKIKRGEVVVLEPGRRVWYHKTREEIEAERQRDIARGHVMTDDGETILYSSQGSITFEEPATVLVTALTKVPWHSWHNKPSGLTAGVITSGRYTGKEVTFLRGKPIKFPIRNYKRSSV
jgi:hypothetical protein